MNNYRKIKYQKIIYKYKTKFGNNQKKKKFIWRILFQNLINLS